MIKRISILISIAFICSIGFSIIGNICVEHYYEIEEPITVDLFNKKYQSLLTDIQNIYYIDNGEKRIKEIKRIKALLIKDPSILKISQQDKDSPYKYGVNYLGYSIDMYTHSYFYKNNGLRRVGDLIRGYVETSDGKKTDAIKFIQNVTINEMEHHIEIIINYKIFYNEANKIVL